MKTKIDVQPLPAVLSLRFLGLLVLFAAFFSLSCKKEPVAPKYFYPQSSEYRHATLPLATQNEWAYMHTYDITKSDSTVRIQLATVDDYTGQTDHGDWKISNLEFNQFTRDFSVANDTIYVYDPWVNGAWLNPRIAFVPYSSVTDTALIPGPYPSTFTKVYRLGHNFTTPAGVFDSVLVYEISQLAVTLKYFRPGIGLLASETSSDGIVIDRSVLVAYTLQH